jgi:hypothetical protein
MPFPAYSLMATPFTRFCHDRKDCNFRIPPFPYWFLSFRGLGLGFAGAGWGLIGAFY